MANLKENKRYHFTYKTVNLINGRYYLGMHSTNKLNDGYIGSGTRLWYEIRKYGKENFKLEVLKHFNSREELVQAEGKLITEEDLKNKDCLNLSPGGSGGIRGEDHYKAFVKGPKNIEPMLQKVKELQKDEEWRNNVKKLVKEGLQRVNHNHATFKGHTHTEDTKKKIGVTNSNKQKGDKNSQYGTCWITDGKKNTKVKKIEELPQGWTYGRTFEK